MFSFPKIVGVLNITPDSFSDGGLYFNKDNAIEHVRMLISQGADVIDIGAESRKPAIAVENNGVEVSSLITADEELLRLDSIIPEVVSIAKESGVSVSIDTRHVAVARYAIDCGVDTVNDAGSFNDNDMIELASKAGVKIVLMHALGIHGDHTKNIVPEDIDIISHLIDWFSLKITKLVDSGIKRSNIIVDVGIGYGKSQKHNWEILRRIDKLKELGNLYVGHSRKSMYGLIGVNDKLSRDLETSFTSQVIASSVDYIRVHNVEYHNRLRNFLKFLF